MLTPPIRASRPQPPAQGGYVLLEVLISMVIFGVGLLGLAGMYAATLKYSSDGKYRMDACQLASTLIAQMLADDRGDLATLAGLYQGGQAANGSRYLAWRQTVIAQLPGVSDTQNMPTVAFGDILDGVDPPRTSKRTVTINVSWQLPGEDIHRYVLHTLIR